MRGFLTAKLTLVMAALVVTFTAGVGGTMLTQQLDLPWTGNTELVDVEAIVEELVASINELTVEIDDLNAEIASLETDATDLQAEVDALIIERDELIAELTIANSALVEFKTDICAVIDTLPAQQRVKYDEWCGEYGMVTVYIPGTYTATVYAGDYNNYSDEIYMTVVVVIDENRDIVSITFDAFKDGDVSKDDYTYLSFFSAGTWSVQSDNVEAAIISEQGWGSADIDGISGATLSFSLTGFEACFDEAMIGATEEISTP